MLAAKNSKTVSVTFNDSIYFFNYGQQVTNPIKNLFIGHFNEFRTIFGNYSLIAFGS